MNSAMVRAGTEGWHIIACGVLVICATGAKSRCGSRSPTPSTAGRPVMVPE
jgi:hypothetical protein